MNGLFSFTTPLLLIGLAAAAIPFLLHLLSSVKAQEVYFPTLRFLQLSMEKTARRRRIQHWLLLLLRSLLLALLAIGAAEPLSRATGGWLTGRSYAAVLIVDNSFSMLAEGDVPADQAANPDDRTRLARAKRQAAALLESTGKPTVAAVMTTVGGVVPDDLTADVDDLVRAVSAARIGYGPSLLAQRVASAVDLLAHDSSPQKSIYVLSDMQKTSFDEVAQLRELAAAKDVHLLIVDTSGAGADDNVAVTKVQVAGKYVLNQRATVRATLVNSASTPRTFEASVRIDGRGEVARLEGLLGAGEGKIVSFPGFQLDRAGAVGGEVFVKVASKDILPLDNMRRFSLDVAGGVPVLIVAGPSPPGVPATLGSAGMLEVALDPFGASAASAVGPGPSRWSVSPRTISARRFGPNDLAKVDAAFFCNVPTFTPAQARAMIAFARGGGTVVIFPGPDTDAANYNRLLADESDDGPLLPAQLGQAVGQVGPTAGAVRVDWVDTTHPYLVGLHEKAGDYLGVRVQRYFRLVKLSPSRRTLLRLAAVDDDGSHHPLMLTDRCGAGRVVLCTTTASRQWSNLPVAQANVFLPMMVRISLLARRGAGSNNTHEAGGQVVIAPRTRWGENTGVSAGARVNVFVPARPDEKPTPRALALAEGPQGLGALFRETERIGEYRWEIEGDGRVTPHAGRFVVNPYGPESRLTTLSSSELTRTLAERGNDRVYVAPTIGAVTEAALADSERDRWWDVLLVAAIIVLVIEALVANRQRRRPGDEVIPAHLNPRMAPSREA